MRRVFAFKSILWSLFNRLRVPQARMIPTLLMGSGFGLFLSSSVWAYSPSFATKVRAFGLELTTQSGLSCGVGYCFAGGWVVGYVGQNINVLYRGQPLHYVGTFQNLSFFRMGSKIDVVPASASPEDWRVQVVTYHHGVMTVNDAFLVGEPQRGSGNQMGVLPMVSGGNGIVGSLVLQGGKAIGVIAQLGSGEFSGLAKMVEWNKLKHIAERGGKRPYVGLSVANSRDGVLVTMVANNSPFKNVVEMGDQITGVDDVPIYSVQDLGEAFTMVGKEGVLHFLHNNTPKKQSFLI